METKEKTVINAEKFEVKVESEAAYLMYENNMSKEKANKVAREIISERFTIG
jgi:hypothetical protein